MQEKEENLNTQSRWAVLTKRSVCYLTKGITLNSTIKSILQSEVTSERQPEIVNNGKYSLYRDLRWAKTWIHILVKHKESHFEDVDPEKSMKNPSRVYEISSDLQAVYSDEWERRLGWFMILAKAHLHL